MAFKAQGLQTILRADSIGSLAARTLHNGSKVIGKVTNTFPNSFYVQTFDDELLFVTNRSLKSPITINLDSKSNLDGAVKPLQRITIQSNTLLIGNDTCIALDTAAVSGQPKALRQSKFNAQSGQIGKALYDAILILNIVDTKQSVLDKRGLVHKAAAEFAERVSISLRAANTDGEFKETAQGLIGLGFGFTPSGDDMLGGFLATYNSFASNFGRPQILMEPALLQRKTSWISAKLLDYMQRLVVDDQVSHMISSAAAGDRDQLILAFEDLLPRGHTSGIDISVGAILALGLIQDMALKEKETEFLRSSLGLVS